MSKEFWDELREQHKDSSEEVKAEVEAAASQAETAPIGNAVRNVIAQRYTPPSQRGHADPQGAPATKPAMGRFTPPSQRKPPGAK